jgi:hypothetical protein
MMKGALGRLAGTAADLAVTPPELTRRLEPTPLALSKSSYALIPLPTVQVKATLEPVEVLPS